MSGLPTCATAAEAIAINRRVRRMKSSVWQDRPCRLSGDLSLLPPDPPHPVAPGQTEPDGERGCGQRCCYFDPEPRRRLLQSHKLMPYVITLRMQIEVEVRRPKYPVTAGRAHQECGEGPLDGHQQAYKKRPRNRRLEPRIPARRARPEPIERQRRYN